MFWYAHHVFGSTRISHYLFQAETLDRNFEKPLRQHLETYRTIVTVRVHLNLSLSLLQLSFRSDHPLMSAH